MRKTFIILATIPFGMIGLVGGLLLTNSFFSFTAFLGLISLMGIIINNAIVLIDRIEIEQVDHGLSPYRAILQATGARFRPILLTTFTTSFGMLPLWFGGGAMWEPMAIGIIFGLFFATAITLLFVPVLYKLLYRIPVEFAA
jgi:multidrug efflux pump subunit AcrB